jgi:hypothetical protein
MQKAWESWHPLVLSKESKMEAAASSSY